VIAAVKTTMETSLVAVAVIFARLGAVGSEGRAD
jgi:hypothetical protein